MFWFIIILVFLNTCVLATEHYRNVPNQLFIAAREPTAGIIQNPEANSVLNICCYLIYYICIRIYLMLLE